MKEVIYKDEEFRTDMTKRVERLREAIINAKPILCSERAKLVTKVYQMNEDVPVAKKRALNLKYILDNITQNIWEDELIVGSHGSNGRRSAPVYPEFSFAWLLDEIDEKLETRTQDTFDVPQYVKDDLKEIASYWNKKSNFDKYRSLLPDETKKIRDSHVFTRGVFEGNGYGHSTYQANRVVKEGLKSFKIDIYNKMKDIDFEKAEDIEKNVFYESLIICIDAVIDYAKRYSKTAINMAEKETDEKRKKELLKIADVCSWVPENPARDMWEGLQAIQFMQLIIQLETNGDSVAPGRADQYLYDLYENDIKDGRYTNLEIQELLDCFWLKFNEIVKVQDSESVRIHPGFPMTPNLTVGGQTPDGKDATNELSYLMLTAQEHVRLTNPQFTARFFEGTPEKFKLRAAEVIKLGTGMPAIFGDEQCINAIHKAFPEIPMERVRDYSIIGCNELAARGFSGRVNGGWTNLARIIDLGTNNGVDRLTDVQLGPKSGEVDDINSYDELLDAIKIQVAYFFKHQIINAGIVDMIQRENTPHLFFSSLIEGCIDSGKDLTKAGTLWGSTPLVWVGLATAINSVISIKKYVFEEKLLTFKELKEILDSNFETKRGQEIQKILIDAPKYGTDNEYADKVAVDITNILFDEIDRHNDIDNRPVSAMILTLGSTVPNGWRTGATADGRMARTPVSDSLSPSNVGKSEGPTAVLKSASKIDQSRNALGNVLNLKINRNMFKDENTISLLKNLIEVYVQDLKGQELQFNVLNKDTLLDAQKNPDKYNDLIVRIAGYSARFVELDVELQNDIIAREEHGTI